MIPSSGRHTHYSSANMLKIAAWPERLAVAQVSHLHIVPPDPWVCSRAASLSCCLCHHGHSAIFSTLTQAELVCLSVCLSWESHLLAALQTCTKALTYTVFPFLQCVPSMIHIFPRALPKTQLYSSKNKYFEI